MRRGFKSWEAEEVVFAQERVKSQPVKKRRPFWQTAHHEK